MRKSYTAIFKSPLTSAADRKVRSDWFQKVALELRSALMSEHNPCSEIESWMDSAWRFEVLIDESDGPKLECIVAWIFGTEIEGDTTLSVAVPPNWQTMSQPDSPQLSSVRKTVDQALRKLNIANLKWAVDDSPVFGDRSRWVEELPLDS